MATYQIPRNYRGETRILYVFTIKALITTAIGAAVGLPFYLGFKSMDMQMVGVAILALFALIGYGLGAFKIPTVAWLPVTKKIGGEPVSEIIFRYIKFKRTKKMYTYYTKEEEK